MLGVSNSFASAHGEQDGQDGIAAIMLANPSAVRQFCHWPTYDFRNERAGAKCSRRRGKVVIKVSIENCRQVVVEERYLEGGGCGTKSAGHRGSGLRATTPHVTRSGAIRKQHSSTATQTFHTPPERIRRSMSYGHAKPKEWLRRRGSAKCQHIYAGQVSCISPMGTRFYSIAG